MSDCSKKCGNIDEFNANWSKRKEASYNHWTRGKPQNQIQLAFRSHWNLFQELIQGQNYEKCLEVGCGRGSISSYFAENGFDCILFDSSSKVLNTARNIFIKNGHKARFVQGNALNMPFEDETFDIVMSIGLLEHFQNIQKPIVEQYRVLKKGGMFLGYIVPENHANIQRYFKWLNSLLSFIAKIYNRRKRNYVQKANIYRSHYHSGRYLPVISSLSVTDIQVMGVYPLPMISHSPEFPFSLLPSEIEKALTILFELVLFVRTNLLKKNPWICREKFGQALLITFKKYA